MPLSEIMNDRMESDRMRIFTSICKIVRLSYKLYFNLVERLYQVYKMHEMYEMFST